MPLRIALTAVALGLCVAVAAPYTFAQEGADALQGQIDSLKNEIEQLTIQLNNTTAQKDTLESAIKSLDLQIQKLTKSISLTNTQISQKDKEIGGLSLNINDASTRIDRSQDSVGEILRELAGQDDLPLMTALLGGGTLSSFFDEAASLGSLRDKLYIQIEDLSTMRSGLVNTKTSAEQKRRELATLRATLGNEQKGLAAARKAQTDLLADTKNRESSYQALIVQKKAEQARFEAALFELASGLGSADRGTAPAPARGILRWPLDNVYVTQQFGRTSSAIRLYTSGTHDGIDFRASIGTPVRAALSGVVQEVNEGTAPNCQYGKWVLVRHNNGLTTLYAHLSSINVGKGQAVATGDAVGFAGNTGYATGPHLHFTVYLSSAVSFKQYTCKTGRVVTVPIAPVNAYLDPLSYLPGL